MARANRHHIPGYIWHITHRCHKREFLLKFEKDKKRWVDWLFQSKKRYDVYELRESQALYGEDFEHRKVVFMPINSFVWNYHKTESKNR